MKHAAILSSVLLASTVGTACAQNPLPAGWREPAPQETTYQNDPWRNESPNKYLVAEADFDGDGKKDVARLLVSSDGKKYALFVLLGSGRTIRLNQDEAVYLQVMGIDVLPPNKYKTACGKGYWDCGKGEPDFLTLHTPGLSYFKAESAESVYFWVPSTKKFHQVWLSD